MKGKVKTIFVIICLVVIAAAFCVCYSYFGIEIVVAIAMLSTVAYAFGYDYETDEDKEQVNILDCLLPVLGVVDIYGWCRNSLWGYAFMLAYYICRRKAIFTVPTVITVVGTMFVLAFTGMQTR